MANSQLIEAFKQGSDRAICYSGYRRGQNPALGIYPSYSDILADLSLLQTHWHCIRFGKLLASIQLWRCSQILQCHKCRFLRSDVDTLPL